MVYHEFKNELVETSQKNLKNHFDDVKVKLYFFQSHISNEFEYTWNLNVDLKNNLKSDEIQPFQSPYIQPLLRHDPW